MLTFIGVVIGVVIAWFILKNVLIYAFRCFPFTISSLLGIGSIMFIFCALANIVSTGTAWAITLIPTAIALMVDIRNVSNTDPDTIKSDVQKMKKQRLGYDEDGNEIDYYRGYKCCGNCIYNCRRHSGGYGWCEKSGYYNDTNIIPNSVTYADQHEVDCKYCCRYWKHF